MTQTFWSEVKVGRKAQRVGPFATREEAYAVAWAVNPNAKSVCTGYGSEGPWFDIRWQTLAGSMIKFAMAETLLEARRLAREAVRAELKSKGHKLQEFSFKQIVELGDDYLAEHRELIDLAMARLDH